MRHIITLALLLIASIATANDWALIVESKPVASWALTCEPIVESGESFELVQSIPRARRALLFTASWCGPCQQMKRDTLPPLVERGWKIGESNTDHIQVIDSDDFPGLMKRWNVSRLPTLIYLEGETEVRRSVGYQSPHAVGQLFDPPAVQAASAYSARWTFPGSGRADLINHLASEHNYTVESLERMTTDQLSQIHDNDHDNTTTRRTTRRFSLQSVLFGGN